jgi:hypothetical protein
MCGLVAASTRQIMEINYWASTTVTNAAFNESTQNWTVKLKYAIIVTCNGMR